MGTENKTGEVWRTRTVTGEEKIVLVVADNGAMAYVIHLAEEGTHTDIEVNCDGLRYGSSDRMYYVPSRNFEEYLRTVTGEQLADVKNKLAASIGLNRRSQKKKLSGKYRWKFRAISLLRSHKNVVLQRCRS